MQRCRFLTGGDFSPRALRLTRCDSVTDSKVWMQEEIFPHFALIVQPLRKGILYGIQI